MNTAKMTKPHPIPVLLLFAAATAVLVWLLLSGVEDEPPRRAARWAETISDLDACCRRKHVRSEQYDHFAAIAAGERREAAARLFRAMALSARVQEAECAAAIGRLGGRYTPPVKVALFRGATDENLARSLAYERQRLRTAPDIGIARALARGNRLAARALIHAAAGDVRHVVLMERLRDGVSAGAYRLCPRCGNLYEAVSTDPYCPICLTAGRNFIAIE